MRVPIVFCDFLLSSFLFFATTHGVACDGANIEACGEVLYQSALTDANNSKEQMIFYNTKYGADVFHQTLNYAVQKVAQNNDKRAFEIMLQAQQQLFDKNTKEDIKSCATNLKIFQQTSLYNTVNGTLISQAEKHLRTLLQLATGNNMFQDCFSLRNNDYKSFIYTASKPEESKSYPVYIWVADVTIDDAGYIAADIKGFDDDLRKFNVTLKGTKYNVSYIMDDAQNHQILGWDSTESPKAHIWQVELLEDNQVLLHQNDYVMCAVDGLDKKRSNVAGRREQYDKECLWIAEPCGVFDKDYPIDDNNYDEEDEDNDDDDNEDLFKDDVEEDKPYDGIDNTVY